MLNAALNGVGLVQHLDLAVQRHIAEGSLVRVLDKWCLYLYGATQLSCLAARPKTRASCTDR